MTCLFPIWWDVLVAWHIAFPPIRILQEMEVEHDPIARETIVFNGSRVPLKHDSWRLEVLKIPQGVEFPEFHSDERWWGDGQIWRVYFWDGLKPPTSKHIPRISIESTHLDRHLNSRRLHILHAKNPKALYPPTNSTHGWYQWKTSRRHPKKNIEGIGTLESDSHRQLLAVFCGMHFSGLPWGIFLRGGWSSGFYGGIEGWLPQGHPLLQGKLRPY